MEKTFAVTDCVTERTGTNAYTDSLVATSPVGYLYAPSSAYCLSTNAILPLSSDIDEIENTIDSLAQGGATAGQIGVAWGWYALSPNIGIWSGDSEPAAYDAANTLKIAVIMTDGQFNTPYCNGVSASDGTNEDPAKRINCKATNGSSASQAVTMCTAMKAAGVTIYAVGFNISGTSTAKTTMKSCASSFSHLYLPDSMSELQTAFESIANEVVSIRLSK